MKKLYTCVVTCKSYEYGTVEAESAEDAVRQIQEEYRDGYYPDCSDDPEYTVKAYPKGDYAAEPYEEVLV